MLASTNPLPLNKHISSSGVRGGRYLRVTDIMKRDFSLGLGVLCLPESLFPLCKLSSCSCHPVPCSWFWLSMDSVNRAQVLDSSRDVICFLKVLASDFLILILKGCGIYQ